MGSLYVNTLNELDKIFLRKKNLVFVILGVLITLGAALSFKFLQNRLGIFAVNAASFSILVLDVFTTLLLPLFIFSAAADLFAGEFGEKNIKITLTRPITRFKIFLSKNIALAIFIVINLVAVYLISVISGLFLKGGSDALAGASLGLLAYATAILPMVFLSIAAIFLSQFFNSSGAALTTSIFVYLVAKVLPFFSSTFSKISPFSYTDWHMMWIGSAVSSGRLLNVFLIILSCSMILFALGFYLFDRKDI